MALRIVIAFAVLTAGAGCIESATLLEEQSRTKPITSLICDAQSCPSGCCAPDGTCQSGDEPAACGAEGSVCHVCASGEVCEAGACVLAAIPDAGSEPFDAGITVDAGNLDAGDVDAGVADAGQVIDAGLDAGFVCDSSTCAGCCVGNVCQAGNVHAQCGSGGLTCQQCSHSELCVQGACTPLTQVPDVAVDSLEVTDLYLAHSGDLLFTLNVSIINIGPGDLTHQPWMVVHSLDTHLSLLSDTVLWSGDAFVSAGATQAVSARVTQPAGMGSGYIWVYADHNYSGDFNFSNNHAFVGPIPAGQPICDPSTCSGCCTPQGCVVVPEQDALTCGSSGAACSACSMTATCVSGVCQ